MHFVVVTGSNQVLKGNMEEMLHELGDYKHPGVDVTVCGYLCDVELADYMKIASLYLGKPGGATTAECEAVGVPVYPFEWFDWEEPNMSHLIRKYLCKMPDKDKPVFDQIIDRIDNPPKEILPVVNWQEKVVKLILAETTPH
jgi:UDP-N-acetylglucosamine:LPS N-acetylglucosamine transferase